MKRFVTHAICTVFLALSGVGVIVAGPLTSSPAVALIDGLSQTARVLAAFALSF